MDRELTPEEEKEYSFLNKKLMHTVFTMSKKDWERLGELIEKSMELLKKLPKKLGKIGRDFINFKNN